MHAKIIVFALLLSVFMVHDAEAWRWVKRAWRTAKRIYYGAKRIYRKHSWVRAAVHHGLRLLGDIRDLRKLDENEFDKFVTKLGEDIAEDFDEDTAKDIVDGLTEMKELSEDEFDELESLASDESSQITDGKDQLMDALKRRLSQTDFE